MARRIIVSLVSAQTIPNILFIKEHWSADFYYFIDTEQTLKQSFTQNIIQSLNLPKSQTQSVKVSESSINDIQGKLKSEIEYEDSDELLINVTGGTKIMSIAVHSFFAGKGIAKIYYLPIEKNQILQIFPQQPNYITEITQTIHLQEYLTAYDVRIISQSSNTLIKPIDQTELLFYAFLEENKRKKLLAIANQTRETKIRLRK